MVGITSVTLRILLHVNTVVARFGSRPLPRMPLLTFISFDLRVVASCTSAVIVYNADVG